MHKLKKPGFLIALILTLGFVVRLHGFSNPIADWHSWRQADTSAVSRNFVKFGFDILHPRFDDLSNVPSGKDNPQGYRFVEFPLYNVAQAGLFVIVGVFTLEEWGRLVSIFASLCGSYFIFKIISKYSGTRAGLAAAFFYTFIPYNIYYSRTILPDPSMVALILGGIYFFDLWISEKKKNGLLFIISLFFTAFALLLKPYAVFYAPVFFILIYKEYGWQFFKQWQLYVFAVFTILPLLLWRQWMQQFPEGIPANSWLLNGNGIRFRPAFFRWLGYERLIRLISGYAGIFFLGSGVAQIVREKSYLFYGAWIVSALSYVTIFATGNVQHDYYQIVIMPVVSIIMGLGLTWMLDLKSFPQSARRVGVAMIVTLSFFFSWQQVRDYFNINNHSIVIAGKAVDSLIPKDAQIMAIYNGDTSFLYQTNRQGWASFEKPIPEMILLGADYLVFANPNQSELDFGKEYKTVSQTKDYVLYDLHSSL